MNINIKNIKWTNFLSYGKESNELKISNGIDLVIGGNGVGKSTMIDVLFYNLFGKPFRKIKTSSLMNRINKKGLYTEVIFDIDENSFKIERSQKPNKFKIYKKIEGEWSLIEEKAATKDYQKMLTEEILNINETIFRQLISVSSNLPSSKPFMELSSNEKESLFQAITDTSIFNHLKDSLKNRISNAKHELSENNYRRDILKNSIDSEKIMISQAEKQNEEFHSQHKNNIRLTQENISLSRDNVEKYKAGLDKLKKLKLDYDKDMGLLDTYKKTLNDSIEKNKDKISGLREEFLSLYNTRIAEIEENYSNFDYSNLEEEIEKIEKDNLNIIRDINNTENKIYAIEMGEKSAITCSNCSTVNYISVDKNEVDKKEDYINNIILLKEKEKENILRIKSTKEQLRELKDINLQDLKNKKDKELKSKEDKDNELNDINTEFMLSIGDKSIEINNLLDKTNLYKEKLLNGKRFKEAIEEHTSNMKYYEEKLVELNNIKLIEVDYTSINNKNEDMKILTDNITILNKKIEDYIYLDNLIGTNNLKGSVIKKQIPFLNRGINYFLELFSMIEYSFIIDENFKERIISRGEDSEFNQLSNGQKARISFAIMFSFLKIIEERNGVKTNILVLDEILDSSVDSVGREELLEILKSEFSNTKDIIIISHNDQIKEKLELFDRIINIEKDKFSKVIVEDIKTS